MTGTYNVDDDDDEFVVIQGSALHEHMSSLGYTDFETVVVQKTEEERTDGFLQKGFLAYMKSIWLKIYSVFPWIIKAEDVSKQHLSIMTNAKVFLNDHAHIIHDRLEQFHSLPRRERIHNLLLTSTVILSSTCALFDKHRRIFNIIFLSSSLLIITYVKYKRVCAKRNLETLISMQNETLDLCKKGMKILRYSYRIPQNRRKGSSQFYALTANRLKFFQSITESVMKCMESMSHVYYKVSLLVTKLLPPESLGNDSFTRFQSESFNLNGEITYQELKELYHIYILTQSEMLHLLSVAYDVNTWTNSYCCLPEEKLAHIIHNLVKYLKVHRDNLSIAIGSYYDFRVEETVPKQTGMIDKKWQDLYIHLHLTSNKLQTAYNHILSILQEIDSDVKNTAIDGESVEAMMQKLNQAYQEIDGARNFAEFSSLLVARTRISNCTENPAEVNPLPPEMKSEPTIITDAQPEIVDEVFEEYIKEEYLKPLYEEGVDSMLDDYKFDKFLAKSFLSELKDALVDKKKSMSERESKALQRMYQNIMRDMDLKGNTSSLPSAATPPRIPTPPPFPENDQALLKNVDTCSNRPTSVQANNPLLSPNRQPSSKGNVDEEPRTLSFIPLPKLEMQTQKPKGSLSFPTSFLTVGEETFIGSGENSEEELQNSSEEDEVEENEQTTQS